MLDIRKTDFAARSHSLGRSEKVPAWSRVVRGGRMTKWKGIVASYAPNLAEIVTSVACRVLPLLLAAGMTVGVAAAADRYWDPNDTAIGRGGAGTWNTSSGLWSPSNDGVSGPYTAWDNGALDDAIFGGSAAGTVTLGAPITVGGMTFETTGYTLDGGTLTLGGAVPIITTNTGVATTINSVLSGASGLTKAGLGTLTLNGVNDFSGNIDVTGGVLVVDGSAALGAAGNGVTLADGAGLSSAGSLAGRVITLSGGQASVSGAGVGSAHFTGAGGLRASGSITLDDNANDYTGPTSLVGGGSLYFSSIGNLGEVSALGAAADAASGTISLGVGTYSSAYARYTGAGDSSNRDWRLGSHFYQTSGIVNDGTGTLTLTGDIASAHTASSISVRNIIFEAATADLELLGTISSNNNGVGVVFTGGGIGRTITVGGANTFGGGSSIQGVTVKANSLKNTGTASALGTGTAGNIGIVNGVLSYAGSGDSSDRIFGISGNSTIANDGTGALMLSGDVTFAAGGAADTLTLGGGYTGTNTLSGIISGTGNLRSNGAGTWVLAGANTFDGSVIVDGGTLQAGNASAFGTLAGLTVNGGTLDLGGFDLTAPSLDGTGGEIALGANTLTVDTDTASSYAGVISGTGGLVKTGVGPLTLSGANTYTGDTTLNGGSLTLDFSADGAPASNIIGADSTLNMAGGTLDIVGADGAANGQSFDGLDIAAGNNRITAASGTGGSVDVDFGAITRTGGLVDFVLPDSGSFTTSTSLGGWATVNGTDYAKVVGGVITAFSAGDYTGQDDSSLWTADQFITDDDGHAGSFFNTVSGSVGLGGLRYTQSAGSAVTISDGETLSIDGTIIVASSVGSASQTIDGGSLTGGPGGGTLGILQNGDGTFTIGSTIVDNGGSTGFTKGGAGIAKLTGANTYTGVTTLSGGELQFTNLADGGQASSLGAASVDASNLVLEGGKLHYVGSGDASTNRGFTLVDGGADAPNIAVDADHTVEFSGLVTSSDNAGLTKTGWGTLVLSNVANDYVGVTTIRGGGGGNYSTLSVNTLADGGVASGIGAASSDSGNIVLSTGGRLEYTGGTVDINRGFTLDSGNGRIAVALADTTLTIAGTAVGAGGLVKDGDGTLILTGTNTYAGGTIVNEGTLRAGSVGAFGNDTSTMGVNSGATLDLGGFDIKVGALQDGFSGGGDVQLGTNTLTVGGANGTFNGTISGDGGFTKTGGGTQILNGGNNTYTGVTTIAGGTLSVDTLADGGVASGIGASGSDSANMVFTGGRLTYTGGTTSIDRGFTLLSGDGYINVSNAATTLEFEGAVVGGGRLRKEGAGTLVLSGSNNLTGTALIEGGILRAGSNDALGPAGVTLANVAGAALDLDGHDNTIGYLNGGGALGGNITLGDATLTLNWASGVASYAGAISGTGGLIKNGGVNQALSGCDSDYTGATVINGGTLTVSCLTDGGTDSSIGASTADASNLVINGATLRYIGTGGSTDRQFTLGASGGNVLDASGTGAIAFTSNAPLTFSGANTAQTLTLTGTNTGDNILAAELTDNGSGVTSLTKSGTGTWILTNPASTYTGVTTIDGGVLGVDKLADGGLASSLGASTADASNLIIGNGSTLRYTGAGDTTNRLFTLSAGTTFIESAGTGAVVFTDTGPVTLADPDQNRTIALGGTNTGDNTLAGSIADAGTGQTILAKNDAGTWVLTGDNTYTGNTVINDGTLKIGGGGTTGSIVSDTINQGTLVFDRSDEYTYGGVISDVGDVEQAGTGTTILTGDSTYTGGTTISNGTLQLGNGGTSGSIVGDVVDNGVLAFDRSDTYTFAGTVSGSGAITQIGSGTTILTADNSYTGGTTITDGKLQLGDGGASGSIVGDVANDGALVFDRSDTVTFDGTISGSGSVEQSGPGTTVLTADNGYTGSTTIDGGVLQLGNGGTSGSVVGDVTNNGRLSFNRSDAIDFDGLITGTGSVVKNGPGVLTLTADNTYGGTTGVNAGTLIVNGDQSGATGVTAVNGGATLGGTGIIGGDAVVFGNLAPGSSGAGTLTVAGDLLLSNTSILNFEFGEANVAGGALNDLVNVGGDLRLDGTLNVSETPGGSFGGGIYRLFNYGGALTDNGLALGTAPTGSDLTVQTSVVGQVNLVNSAGLALSFWDGDAGPKFDDLVDGGDGTWHLGGTDNNWTDSAGTINAAYADGSFAIFAGAGGTVTVDNGAGQVTASGMQFASDGYLVGGGDIALVGPQSTIEVGDHSALGAGFTATIASALTGATELVKTDDGTLVLTGANSYTGGTVIDGGALQLGDGGTAGSIVGDVVDNGVLAFNWSNAQTFAGVITGTGTVTQIGAGTVTLTADNSYTGETHVQTGTLVLTGGGKIDGSSLTTIRDGGTLTVSGNDSSLTTAALAIGDVAGSSATLNVEAGGTVGVTGNSPVVVGIAGNGVVNVDGTGSSLTVADALQLGGAASGLLNLTDGGQVFSAGGVIGASDGGGEALVTGDGSLWKNTGNLTVGTYGAGKLTIGAGAAVSNADGVIDSDASGEVIVTGGGSTWSNTGQLTVGSYGIGTLRVEAGATVTSNQGYIGSGDTGDGTVTVTGFGSSWETTLNINVGNYGKGSLTIADGALVRAALGVDLGLSAADASGTLILEGTTAVPATLETSQIRGGLGTANMTINGGVIRATADNADFVSGFGAQEITIATNGAIIDTDDHDIGIAARFSGAGGLLKLGAGTLTLSGTNGYKGATVVSDGTLLVNGDQSAATGLTSVGSATLGGTGIIGGDVTVAGGTINPGDLGEAPGTLTINGNLSLDSGSTLAYNFGQAGVAGGAFNDLVEVGGDLTLDGTLNVDTSAGGAFDPGVYRVISYEGALTNNGLAIGTIPSADFYVQTTIPGQVNLVNTAGMTLRYWDGETIASKNSGTIEGGDGTWQSSAGNDNWTGETGAANAPFTDAAFAVFAGTAGTVSVDESLGTVSVSGMQFLTDGYEIEGDAINLTGAPSSVIRVGDGTLDGAAITATIDSELTGSSQLVKADLGTLILTGANSYTGGTAVNGGTLLVNGDQSAASALTSVGSATLGGTGIIGGDVEVSGGTIAPGSNGVGTLTVKGNMTLDAGSTLAMEFGEADAVGGTLNDLIEVGGDLVLDGTINVTQPAGGSFDTGIYRVFNYDGDLTDNGLELGTMPTGSAAVIQTSVAGQVNLINTSGLFLNFWDGAAGPKFDDAINGGDGVWQTGSGNDNWTDDAGALNAPYLNGGFAMFEGMSGTVTIDNSLGQVTASSLQFASDGYTITGDGLELVGAQAKIRVGDGSNAGGSIIAIIASQISGASELAKTDLGTLVLTGDNSYTGGTAINGGTLQIAADTALGDAAGGLSFNGGTLHTTADMTSDRSITTNGDGTLLADTDTTLTWNGLISGTGALTKQGAGTLLLTADNSGYLGDTRLNDGTLAVDGSLGGNVDVAAGGRLQGHGQIGSVSNAGVVAPGNSIGTLTITGDYTGGGTLEIEATLGGDSSPTDLLAIGGGTSGSTVVTVINRGGLGAQTQDGIKIIDVGGASNGTFTLRGDYLFEGEQAVVAGAYGYRLYKNGIADPSDGDWYLRSALLDPVDPTDPGPLYQPGVPIYESYAGALQQLNKLDTLQQRVGNRQWAAGVREDTKQGRVVDTTGIWARIEAAHAEVSPDISTSDAHYDVDTWKFQAGIDSVLTESGAGRFVGGIFLQYGIGSSHIRSPYGTGSIATAGYGFGATLTWYGEGGFYADGQAQVTWYDSDLNSGTAGRNLVDGNNGVGYAFSIEAGKRIALREGWSLTPQAQLSYSSASFDDFTDSFGADVSLDHSHSLLGRFGMAVNHDVEWQDATGHINRAHLYGIANIYYDFAGGSKIDVAGTPFSSRKDRLYGGIGLGGSLNWVGDKYALYGEAQLNTSLENSGDSNTVGGTVGFRVRW